MPSTAVSAIRSPAPHRMAPPVCWSARGVGPQERWKLSRAGASTRPLFMIATPRKAWNGTIRNTNSSRAMWGRRQRDGSRPTSGHQNSSPTAMKCRCTRSWTSGWRRVRSNRGEK
jgi:hypothetical protein